MDIVTSPTALQERCMAWRREGLSIALAPTMGYFHAGHESLMREGRNLADKLVVSLFVNPAQFGPDEDLDVYPRDPLKDTEIALQYGTDILFMPSPEDMYLPGHATWVEAPELGKGLCGESRPTHFRGVATVVTKLFMLSQPTWALFGEKDWQQLAIIRRMARDLFIPVTIVGMPIVREADGLAMSSRNAYLSPEERMDAPHLQEGLRLARDMVTAGIATDTATLSEAVIDYWQRNFPAAHVDYLEFVDPDSLRPVEQVSAPTLAAAALYVERTRLIDNLLINV